MWIFTKQGFFSIVQDKNDENYLIVRARVKGDIETLMNNNAALLNGYPIEEDAGSDYRYRVRMERDVAEDFLLSAVQEIDYTNYKAAVHTVDDRRSIYYGMIWSIMADMQEHILNDISFTNSE